MKKNLEISEIDIIEDTTQSAKSLCPWDSIDERIVPEDFFKELITKEDYLIQRLKENISDGVAIAGDSLEQHGGIDTINDLLKMCDQMYEKANDEILSEGFLGIMQSIDVLKEQLQHWHDYKNPLAPPKTKGKKRIHQAVNVTVLRAINFCQTYHLDLDWLRKFLLPNGELYFHLMDKYGPAVNIPLSIPTNSTSGKTWLDGLIETSERSLFGIKKASDPDFIRQKEEFYRLIKPQNEELYDYYTNNLDRVIANYDKL